jgi:hypothetical protein
LVKIGTTNFMARPSDAAKYIVTENTEDTEKRLQINDKKKLMAAIIEIVRKNEIRIAVQISLIKDLYLCG